MSPGAFDADIQCVVMLNFEEGHLDEHLCPRTIEVGNRIANGVDGLLIAHDDEVSGIINGDRRGADLAIGRVLLLAGAAVRATATTTATAASESAEPSESAKTAEPIAAGAAVNIQRCAQADTQAAGQIFFPMTRFHFHLVS